MWHYAERPRKGPLILLLPPTVPESSVAPRGALQFNYGAHEPLDKHVGERMETSVQTAAGTG